ncbi:MAG: hypothetical protein F4Z18_11180 [Caldilineaceae bacterium SB0666_bin_21]|nr:hypothetical protein [Caldilineaceae bacterium SB0666_bin_21]
MPPGASTRIPRPTWTGTCSRERPLEAGPTLLALWKTVMQGRVRGQAAPIGSASANRLEGWFGRFKPRTRLTRGLKTRNFVHLMARRTA